MTPVVVGIVLLAAWLGAAVLVAGVVAPAAFAVLPSRTLAGALVGRVLPVLFWSGLAVGLATMTLARTLPARAWTGGAGLVLAAACAAAQLVIAPRIARIRASVAGPIDALDPTDPMRQAFGRLHAFSVAWLGVAALAAFLALVVLVRLTSSRSAS
jgi:hypothetical protein